MWIVSFISNTMSRLAADSQVFDSPTADQLNLHKVSADEDLLKNFLSVVFGLVAAVAILIIVIAGLNMAKSEGNPEDISKARKTIIYALVGLVIALSAEVMVYFILRRL